MLQKFAVNIFTCKLKLLPQQGSNVKVLDNFKTVAVFDRSSGAYACEIQLQTSIDQLINAVKNVELTLELEVRYSYSVLMVIADQHTCDTAESHW